MSAPAMPAAQLALLLEDTAAGICADTAAVGLICSHGHFLRQPGFRRLVAAGSSIHLGNPLGEDRSITAGIVSALQRQIVAPAGAPIDHAIQTDAALNHGNSGGPLLNAHGAVIGVSSQIQTDGSGGNIGIGFAIPINTVKNVAAQLIAKGAVVHAFLGVEARAIAPADPLPAIATRLPRDDRVTPTACSMRARFWS